MTAGNTLGRASGLVLARMSGVSFPEVGIGLDMLNEHFGQYAHFPIRVTSRWTNHIGSPGFGWILRHNRNEGTRGQIFMGKAIRNTSNTKTFCGCSGQCYAIIGLTRTRYPVERLDGIQCLRAFQARHASRCKRGLQRACHGSAQRA